MKSIIITASLFLSALFTVAQPTYEQAMGMALQEFGKAQSVADMKASASKFDQIAEVEKEQWLPVYYSSMIYAIMVFISNDPVNQPLYAEEAQKRVSRAIELAPNESEVFALQGMVYQTWLVIDPAKNGQTYSAKMNGALQKAMKLNQENPRPYYLQGVSLMHTPEQYGGGKNVAKPMLETAMQKFNSYTPKNDLYPNWGKDDCEKNLEACKL